MPLIKSGSKKAFSENVSKEMDSGKPQKQALAIAFSVKRRAAHKAKGGMMEPENEKLHPHYEPHMLAKAIRARKLMTEPQGEEIDMPKKGMSLHEGSEYPVENDEHYAKGGYVPSMDDTKLHGTDLDSYDHGMDEDMHDSEIQSDDEDRALAMKDTYPDMNHEESDTMASEQGFGEGSLDNEESDQDENEARSATARKARLGKIMGELRQRHFGKP